MATPITKWQDKIAENLNKLGIKVYPELPGPKTSPPYAVIGWHNDTWQSVKNANITNVDQQIDYFTNTRSDAEGSVYAIKSCLGTPNASSNILIDNTTSRKIYHVVITVSAIVGRYGFIM